MTVSVIKSSYIKAGGSGSSRAKAHVRYIAFRPGSDSECRERTFFSLEEDEEYRARQIQDEIDRMQERGVLIHRLIVSPGIQNVDLEQYTRELLYELQRNKGLDLIWRAVIHDNTKHRHAHVIIFGKDQRGKQVKLDKYDLAWLRKTGDKYLQRNHQRELYRLSDQREEQRLTKEIEEFLDKNRRFDPSAERDKRDDKDDRDRKGPRFSR